MFYWLLGFLAVVWTAIRVIVGQPVPEGERSALTADTAALQTHVRTISENFHPRDYLHPQNLDACAEYIRQQFEKTGAQVRFQDYQADGRTYRNVVARIGTGTDNLIVVAAHYDTCGHTPGADDNASGVAGLLELARLLAAHPTGQNIELVACPLEEPPYFRTSDMGSVHHARSLRGSDVRGVIVLEMIGYFSDQAMSQDYPSPVLRLFYPSTGNFIALAGRNDQWRFMREFKSHMSGTTPLPVWSINASAKLPGLDFSDHASYWNEGYNAIMVTDTAFYRNKAYHEPEDTWDRLDYRRMGDVVVGVYEGIKGLKGR